MSKHILRAFLVVALVAGLLPQLSAQTDRQVKEKQGNLKEEYNNAQEKNLIIESAAEDKPTPTTGRSRRAKTTGYDYTQVKGYLLRQYYERIDNVFARANELGMFEEEYREDGTFPVPGRKGQGSSQMRRVEVYYVEARPDEQELYGVDPFHLIEVYVEKLETLPPEEASETGDEGSLMFQMGGSTEPIAKGFSLSGSDLVSIMDMVDENLYEDILSKRAQSTSIELPERGDWMPGKVGPFIVMTQRELETMTSRFNDFWNKRDTLESAVEIPQFDAAGPLYSGRVPKFYSDVNKTVRVRNPERNTQLKITNAAFVGANADKFAVRVKLPKVLDPKGGLEDDLDVNFEYIGESPYEVRGQLMIEAKDANMSQMVDIIANPGLYPADFVTVDASLDRIELRSPSRSSFAPDWKLAYTLGNDEIGMPRWATGISSLSVGYKNQMSVGIVLPMNMSAPDLPSPLAFDKGLLSSAGGYDVNFDFTFGFPFSIGGNLTVINDFEADDPYDHLKVIKSSTGIGDENYENDFFHISTIAQVYYPIMFKDNNTNPTLAFRLNLGGAFMQVKRDHLVQQSDLLAPKLGREFTENEVGTMVTLGKEKDIVDIYVRMSFINLRASNRYGMGVQYFSGRMMADAFLELTSWLRVEAKYSFLLRDQEIWESESNYFLITPRLRIGLPSIFN